MIKIFESVVYIISIIFLIKTFINFKKSNQELNLIHWIIISLLILFCYNSFVVYVLNLLHIPSYLFILSIINYAISFFISSKKEKQKYFFEKKDIVAVIIFVILTFLIMIFRFGIPFKIAYETCDSGTHFWTAKDFYEQSYLLNTVKDETIVNFETRQTASYTNLGIIFKTVSPVTDDFNLYIFYIIFDIYMLFLSAMCFYILISNITSKSKFISSIVITTFYVLGYPLNNMIFGFFYSGHAVTIICLILYLIRHATDGNFNQKIFTLLLALINFGLFFTYYFYTPVVFIGLFIYFVYIQIKSKNKIISFEFIKKNFAIFGIAVLCGLIYYVVPNIGNPETTITTQINLNGYYYNNIFSNFTLLIPIVILSYVFCIKDNKLELDHFMLIFLIIFMFILTMMIFSKSATGYYLSKNYYLLWLIVFSIYSKFFINGLDKIKIYFIVYQLFISLVIFVSCTNFEEKIINIEEWEINKTSSSNLFDIYKYNLDKVLNGIVEFTPNELKMLHNVYKIGATDLQTNSFYDTKEGKIWLAAWFRTVKIRETTENQLFDYLAFKDYYDAFDGYICPASSDISEYNYKKITESNTWYLLFYKKLRKKSSNIKCNTEILEGKKMYDKIDRNTCVNCKFYDFEDGLLIYKE